MSTRFTIAMIVVASLVLLALPARGNSASSAVLILADDCDAPGPILAPGRGIGVAGGSVGSGKESPWAGRGPRVRRHGMQNA